MLITRTVSVIPSITTIDPAVGTPGDVLVIRGDNFGNTRNTSYVEMSGNRLTESCYLSWDNHEIKVIIPGNTQDGLVYVVSQSGKSNPEFFANESAIPMTMPANPMQNIPLITSISASKACPGQLLTISGKNFGSTRETSNVYFTSRREEQGSENQLPQNINADTAFSGYIAPSEIDFDYEYWSESEIRVRVPDGATSGSVHVETPKGKSISQPIIIETKGGTKKYTSHNTYLIQTGVDIADITGGKNASITIYLPHPLTSAAQPMTKLIETKPEPLIENYRNTSLFQVFAEPDKKMRHTLSQNFVISSYSIETEINKETVRQISDRQRMLCRTYTRADELVPADTKELKELLPGIIYQVKNPYRQAELIYQYMTANFKYSEKKRSGDVDALDILKSKRGDAYTLSILYTALLRTAGIPSRVVSGILVDADKHTKNHWWCEYYLEDFGWIPVDVALGLGMEFKPFHTQLNSSEYYFGNLDSQHIAFSAYWTTIKQALAKSRIIVKPKFYALQSIWEEASEDITGYSSFWSTPSVLGIY